MDLRFWNKPRICTRRMILEALEERIVMDAAVDYIPQDNAFTGRHVSWDMSAALDDPLHVGGVRHAAAVDNVMPVHSVLGDAAVSPSDPGVSVEAAPAVSPDPLSEVFSNKGLDIVLVSTDADQYDAISHAVNNGAKALLFDPHEESLQSISDKLHDLTSSVEMKIDHLAIIAPGSAGHLKIGADDITGDNVEAHQSEFKALAQSMSPDARIDLYGCDIAQGTEGANLVNKVASATGVTVWASSDVTGTVPGANWDLEVKSAADTKPYMIDANALSEYSIHLADPMPGTDTSTVNKTATGIYRNLSMNATDVDQPAASNVTFTPGTVLTSPGGVTAGTVALTGDVTELSPGAYEQLFTFTADPTTLTGTVEISYSVSSDGFTATGAEIDITPITDAGASITCAAFGNVDDDGVPDIVIGTDAGAYYLINNGDGTFGTATLITGTDTYNITSIAMGPLLPNHVCGDLDDIALGTNARNRWVVNYGDGTTWDVYPVGSSSDTYDTTAIAIADLGNTFGYDIIEVNSDGEGPVVYSNDNSSPNYYNTAGTPIDSSAGSMTAEHALAVADVNGDDINDVIVGVDGEQIRYYLGNGDGTVDSTVYYVGSSSNAYNTLSLLVTDLDDDGDNDIVQGNADDEYAYVYLNDGTGTFADGVLVEDAGWPKGIQFGDVNGDGYNDLLFGNLSGVNKYFLGDGTGTFTNPGIDLNTDNNHTVAISYSENWIPDNGEPEIVVVSETWTDGGFTETFSPRLYTWDTETTDGGLYTLVINPFNRPPVNYIDGDDNFFDYDPQSVDPVTGTLVFSSANGNALTVEDPDALTNNITVTLTAENGNDMYLGSTVPSTVTATGDGTTQIVLTGPQADINTTMDGLLYRSHRGRYADTEALVIQTTDNGYSLDESGTQGTAKTDEDRISITVDLLYPAAGGDAWWNEAPRNQYGGSNINATNPAVAPETDDTGQVTFTGDSQITVWDPDADASTDAIVVTLMPVGGDIRLTSTDPTGVTLDPVGDETSGALMLTGTQDAINSALDGMMFRVLPTSNGSASLTIVSNDQGYNDHDEDGTAFQNVDEARTDTDTIQIDTTTNPITDPWWNTAPVNYYGALPISTTNPGSALVLSAANGTLVFDGSTGTGHAQLLSVVDDAEDKAPLPRVDHDADVQTVLSTSNGLLTVASGWPSTVSVTNNGSTSVTLVGPPTDLSMALAYLEYDSPYSSFVGGDTLLIQTNDLGHNPSDYVGALTDTDAIAIRVNAPTDANGNVYWGRSPRT